MQAAGTKTAPLATVSAAVDKLRVVGGAGNTVILRDGIHRMAETLEIGPMVGGVALHPTAAYPNLQRSQVLGITSHRVTLLSSLKTEMLIIRFDA